MELRDYLKVVRARLPLIALCVAAVTFILIGFGLLQKPTYAGTAQIVFTQQNAGLTMLGLPQPEVSYQPGRDEVQTQVEVISSYQLAQAVRDELEVNGSVEDLLDRLEVTADTGTNVITIRATDTSALRAAKIANAFAAAYIDWSRDNQRASIKAAADDVGQRLKSAQDRLVEMEAAATGPDATVADQVKLETARSQYSSLADRIEELRIAEQLSTGAGSLLASATPDPTRISPSHRRNAGLGLALGLLLGLGVTFAAEQLDTRVKTPQQVADICDAPVLATIPLMKGEKGRPFPLALAHRSDDPDAEAYRILRNSLDFARSSGQSVKTVLVTSAMPGEGKSTVAANLAAALSRTGSRVALVVCDFRLPAVEKMFGLKRQAGLSELLSGASSPWAALQQPTGFENLWVLSAGAMPPNPSELLGSPAMGSMLTELSQSVDWVILDSAPVLATADAAAVSRWVDCVLWVARVGLTKADDLRAGRDQLANVGARAIGVAVLAPISSVPAYGYYGSHSASRGAT